MNFFIQRMIFNTFMFIGCRKAKTNIDKIFWPTPNILCLIYIIYKRPMPPWRISTYWPTPVGIRTIGSCAIKFTHFINDHDKLYGDASIFLFRFLSAHKSSVKRTKSMHVMLSMRVEWKLLDRFAWLMYEWLGKSDRANRLPILQVSWTLELLAQVKYFKILDAALYFLRASCCQQVPFVFPINIMKVTHIFEENMCHPIIEVKYIFFSLYFSTV